MFSDARAGRLSAAVPGSCGRTIVYRAADDKPLTREQTCVEACWAPRFAGRKVPTFTGSDGGVGKVIDSSSTRAAIGWQPRYQTFGESSHVLEREMA